MTVSRFMRKGGGAATAYPTRSSLDIALHWVTVFLLMLTITLIFVRSGVEDHDWRFWLRDAHRLIGLSLFAVTVLRLILRIMIRQERSLRPFNWPAEVVHIAILISMVAIPLLGLLEAAAEKNKPTLFSTIPLPTLIDKDRDLAEILVSIHSGVAMVLIALIALHVMAALWHQFYLKDGIIDSMLPKILRNINDTH